MSNLYDSYSDELESLRQSSSFRSLNNIENTDNKYIIFNGKKLINLSSNDYLGLASDESLLQEFYESFDINNINPNYKLTSSSSRLLTGNSPLYSDLEQEIAQQYHREGALIFNSGYHANIGIIQALTTKNDLILSDKLNHASLIDGIRLSNATSIRYKHCDYEHIEKILQQRRNKFDKVFIISESVFSMDGDIVNIQKLIELKNKYNAILYIDEAHSVGVFGENGLGICEENDVINDVDIIVGTFGKALASQGAFAVFNQILKNYLINKMRSLIFTTALPPITLSWNLFIMRKLKSFSDRRKSLKLLSDKFRNNLREHGLLTRGDTNIIPAIIGSNHDTVNLAKKLQNKGYLVFAIRPPTVPENTARLRFSLTANLNFNDIKIIPNYIGTCIELQDLFIKK